MNRTVLAQSLTLGLALASSDHITWNASSISTYTRRWEKCLSACRDILPVTTGRSNLNLVKNIRKKSTILSCASLTLRSASCACHSLIIPHENLASAELLSGSWVWWYYLKTHTQQSQGLYYWIPCYSVSRSPLPFVGQSFTDYSMRVSRLSGLSGYSWPG